MLQTLLNVFVLTVCTSYLHAQTSEIQNWTENHPNVLLIDTEEASSEMLEQLDARNVAYILYTDEIQLSDIESYEIKHKPLHSVDLSPNEGEAIKKWKAEHSDEIIQRSFYDQMDPGKQAVYEASGALILLGETITLEDIQNYQ